MYYYNNELPPQQGWVCPKCGRVNAPWMPTCGCVSSQTSGSGAPYLVKTSSISRDSHEVADTPQTEDDLLLELMDAVERGEMSDASANQAYVEYISKRVEESDTPQTERKSCKLELFDDDGNYIEPQTDCPWK